MPAFKIDPDTILEMRTIQDEEPCMIYTFLDFDEEVEDEIEFNFVWTGLIEDPVQVFTREKGKPKWFFKVSEADIRPLTAEDLLKEFQLVCNKWIAITLPTLRGVHNAGLEIW